MTTDKKKINNQSIDLFNLDEDLLLPHIRKPKNNPKNEKNNKKLEDNKEAWKKSNEYINKLRKEGKNEEADLIEFKRDVFNNDIIWEDYKISNVIIMNTSIKKQDINANRDISIDLLINKERKLRWKEISEFLLRGSKEKENKKNLLKNIKLDLEKLDGPSALKYIRYHFDGTAPVISALYRLDNESENDLSNAYLKLDKKISYTSNLGNTLMQTTPIIDESIEHTKNNEEISLNIIKEIVIPSIIKLL